MSQEFKLIDGESFRLAGHHFVANVMSGLEKKTDKLITIDKDPRKARLKPDAYPVVVEGVGPGCSFVEVGDTVVIERWQWKQFNIDDERLIASEADLLILNGSIPAPGVIVMKVIEDVQKTPLIVPSSVAPKNQSYIHGVITHSSHPDFQPNWEIWIEKLDHAQFKFRDKLVFRVNEAMASVLAYREPTRIELEVV